MLHTKLTVYSIMVERFIVVIKKEDIKMKGFVDKDTCIGCGICVGVCPDIFEMDVDDLAVAKEIEIPEDVLEAAKEAADQCPVAAITVE